MVKLAENMVKISNWMRKRFLLNDFLVPILFQIISEGSEALLTINIDLMNTFN